MSVQSVNRAVDIMSLFSAERTRLGITEIATALELSKTTVHGLVRTLKERGLLRQDANTRKYSLGMKIFDLGATLGASLKINRAGHEALWRLAEQSAMNAHLALWARPYVLVALSAFPRLPGQPLMQMGPRLPAHCAAVGKAVLMGMTPGELERWWADARMERFTPNTVVQRQTLEGQLARFRRQGFAEDHEEFMLGLSCYAAPLKERGVTVGAIAVSASPGQLAAQDRKALTGLLLAAAAQVSRALA